LGRFYQRYLKHPERGTEYYFDQISAYAASICLGRAIGEDINEYIEKHPGYKECLEDRKLLSEVAMLTKS
jgi:hypothetical protein